MSKTKWFALSAVLVAILAVGRALDAQGGIYGPFSGDATNSGPVITVVGLNGTLLSGLSTGLLKITTGTGVPSIAVSPTDYSKVNSHVADTAIAVVASTGHTQGLLASGATAGFYRITSGVTVTTPATGTCTGPVTLQGTNDFGTLSNPVIGAGPTLTAAAGTMTQFTYSFYDAGTTATTITLTPSAGCTGSGVYDMYSTIERLF